MTRLLDERLDSRRSMNDTILTAHRDGAQMSTFLAMALDEYTPRGMKSFFSRRPKIIGSSYTLQDRMMATAIVFLV